MLNKGFCVIRTKKEHVVNVYTIATFDFMKSNKYYTYENSYECDRFDILENVGGCVIIELYQKMKYSSVEIKTQIVFEQGIVEEIRIEEYIH